MWQDIAEFGKKLVEYGLVESQFGNISIRSGENFIITKTGVPLDRIKEHSVVKVDICTTSDLDKKASSEIVVHRSIYRNTPMLSIIHAHPMFSVIESMLVEGDFVVPINIEGEYFLHKIPVVKGAAGSHELADNTARALSVYKGVIVLGHGTFAGGKTLEEAYFVTALIEKSCKMKYYFDLAKRKLNP